MLGVLGDRCNDGAVQVRPLEQSDRSRWDPLWQGYLEFYEHPLDGVVTDLTFSRLVGEDPAMSGLVSVDGADLLGLCHLVVHPSTWSAGPYCYLEDLFVRPDARRRGAARALLEASVDLARAAGASRLYWQTHSSNVTARGLYDAVASHRGFLVYEVDLQG